MTATTANRDAHRSEGQYQSYEVYESTTIYKGTLVCLRSDGYAVSGADTSGYIFVGVAHENVDNSSGASGAKRIKVECMSNNHYVFKYNGSPAITNVGEVMYVVDNQTVGNTSTNGIKVGRATEIYTGSASQPSPSQEQEKTTTPSYPSVPDKPHPHQESHYNPPT